MELIKDYEQSIEALWDKPGKCRIRVYQGKDSPTVIICTEMPDNQSGSIVTVVEWIAKDVWEKEGRPTPFIWIEHYPSSLAPDGIETFHRVTFVQPLDSSRFFNPKWEAMTRAEVERLLGQTA